MPSTETILLLDDSATMLSSGLWTTLSRSLTSVPYNYQRPYTVHFINARLPATRIFSRSQMGQLLSCVTPSGCSEIGQQIYYLYERNYMFRHRQANVKVVVYTNLKGGGQKGLKEKLDLCKAHFQGTTGMAFDLEFRVVGEDAKSISRAKRLEGHVARQYQDVKESFRVKVVYTGQ